MRRKRYSNKQLVRSSASATRIATRVTIHRGKILREPIDDIAAQPANPAAAKTVLTRKATKDR
jgi:hypothetical protein